MAGHIAGDQRKEELAPIEGIIVRMNIPELVDHDPENIRDHDLEKAAAVEFSRGKGRHTGEKQLQPAEEQKAEHRHTAELPGNKYGDMLPRKSHESYNGIRGNMDKDHHETKNHRHHG